MNEDLFSPESTIPHFTVSQFIDVINQTLDYAFPLVEIEGEVANFKISKDRWVFFDLKDPDGGIVPCFMTIFQLRIPLEDGMKVVISGHPKIAKFGKFSVTINQIKPIGEGSIKKAFELLKARLEKEGLFDPAKKRPMPDNIKKIGVIASINSAGYADFCKILNERWGGLTLEVANTGVQGLGAADEIIRALNHFNESSDVDIIVIIRGGGSKDDLAVFNDELLTRRIASSRIPTLTGIGHEIDESLADLASDLRASTPTNAAEMLSRDKRAEKDRIRDNLASLSKYLIHYIDTQKDTNIASLTSVKHIIEARIDSAKKELESSRAILESLNPENILKQGYSIVTGKISPGSTIDITTHKKLIKAKVEQIHDRN